MSKYMLDQILMQLKPAKVRLAKGEALFLQNDATVNFYCIITGKVKLIRNTIEGTQAVIHVALAGETFAEASIFSSEYHCSAIAVSESVIMSYRKSELLYYLEGAPDAMQGLLRVFSQQVRDLRLINEIKNIRSARDRILAFIESEMDSSREVFLNMSLKDLAYKIGLAHETFYRELKNLEKRSILKRHGNTLKLLNSIR